MFHEPALHMNTRFNENESFYELYVMSKEIQDSKKDTTKQNIWKLCLM